jgi:hypothetical protein
LNNFAAEAQDIFILIISGFCSVAKVLLIESKGAAGRIAGIISQMPFADGAKYRALIQNY